MHDGMNRCREVSGVSTDRAQSALIGFVLLIGMVATVSVGIFIVAGDTISSTESQTESERVEQAFVELSQNMRSVSTSSDTSRSMELDAGEFGAVVKENTSSIRISGGDVDTTIPVGAIEYQGDDGTRIAYQGGAVFKETGEQTQVISAPPIEYDDDAESLWFPIIKTIGESHLSSGDVTINHHSVDPLRQSRLVENDTVTIEVTSEYYRGWEAYFERQGGPTAVQNVEVYEENESGTVTAEFGYLDIEQAFSDGATLSGDYNGFDQADVSMDINEGSMYELDDVIHDFVEEHNESEYRQWADDPEDGPWIINGTSENEFEDGTYFASEVDLEEDVTFDLSDGNATLIVDGDVRIDNNDNLIIKNWDKGETNQTLKTYSTGDLDLGPGTMCVDTCASDGNNVDSAQNQVYGTSDMHIDLGQGTTVFEGTIYAASNDFEHRDYQVQIQSDVEFYGAIIASSMDINSAGPTVSFDESLEDENIDIYPDGYLLPPQLTYLNIAEHKVTVDGN